MIEVTKLTKKYGGQVAVDELTFRLEKGRIYGFLGPNGAGKSTTMNMITGYLAPTAGTITIDGKDVQKEPEEAKKKVGYLPEIPPLYVDMTVWEYLKFVAELKKIAGKEQNEKVRQVMELTRITDVQDRLIRHLSKGYKQRVGLAQAILGDPEVIILDEPTVGLDPKQIIEIRDLIRKLGENHTIILSSHILSEVSAVCDQIIILSHGKLVASDTPEGLQKRMSGAMELELVVKGEEEAVLAVLEEVPQVDTVEIVREEPEERQEKPGKSQRNEPEGEQEEKPGERQEAEQKEAEKKEEQHGLVRVHIVSQNNADIRENVFYALAEVRLPIMEMHAVEKSLEDIFLELTGEEEQSNESNL